MTPTDAQIAHTLRLALGWRACGNVLAAKVRLADLRKRLKGERRDALDRELKKHRFLREVLEDDRPVARTPYGAMPGKHADARGWV